MATKREVPEDNCGAQCPTPVSLVEQLKAKRARVSRKSAAQIRTLDSVIRQLEETEAEGLVQHACDVLQSAE